MTDFEKIFFDTPENNMILKALELPILTQSDIEAMNVLMKAQKKHIQDKLNNCTTTTRVRACEVDIRLFTAYYLDTYLFPHQVKWNYKLDTYPRYLLEAQRGGAKSTLSMFCRPLKFIVYDRNHHHCFICQTSEKATERVTRIRNILQENKILIEDFGLFFDRRRYTTSKTHEFSIIGNTYADFKTLGAYGWDKKKTGGHFNEINLDDITDQEECLNQRTVDKQEIEVFGNITNMLADKYTSKLNCIATEKGVDSIYKRIEKRATWYVDKEPGIQKGMEYIESNQDENGEPIYEFVRKHDKERDVYTIVDVNVFKKHLNKFKVLCPYLASLNMLILNWFENSTEFYREIQCEVIGGEGNIFKEEYFNYYDASFNIGSIRQIIIGVDLSYGSGKDYSAIVVVGKDEIGRLYILDCYRHNELSTTDFYEHIERIYIKYKHWCTGVILEINAGFKETIEKYNQFTTQEQTYIPFSGVKHSKQKELRIEMTLLHLFRNGTIFMPDENVRNKNQGLNALYHQLLYFRSDAKNQVDDIVDALEMAVNGIVNKLPTDYIHKKRKPQDFDKKRAEQIKKFKI